VTGVNASVGSIGAGSVKVVTGAMIAMTTVRNIGTTGMTIMSAAINR